MKLVIAMCAVFHGFLFLPLSKEIFAVLIRIANQVLSHMVDTGCILGMQASSGVRAPGSYPGGEWFESFACTHFTMKIKLLKPMAVKGHPHASVGDILEVDSNTFQILEALGGAVVSDEKTMPVQVVETREPVVESRDPGMQPDKSSKRSRAK